MLELENGAQVVEQVVQFVFRSGYHTASTEVGLVQDKGFICGKPFSVKPSIHGGRFVPGRHDCVFLIIRAVFRADHIVTAIIKDADTLGSLSYEIFVRSAKLALLLCPVDELLLILA